MTFTAPAHVVIAGGGIAGVEALLALRDLAGDRVRITLVAPEADLEMKPMRVATPFSAGHVSRYPLADLAGDGLQAGALASVDPGAHRIRLTNGETLDYDALVVAVGARSRAAFSHALTFGAETGGATLGDVVADLEEGYSHSVAFVVPPGVSWPLPLYELALMTAGEVRGMGMRDAEITIVTPEDAPLAIFGPAASDAVAGLLREAGIAFRGGVYADVGAGGRIALHPGGDELRVERVVSIPVLDGPGIEGLPATADGFLPIDDHARVRGCEDVYAAGDGADFAIKQGGLGCQQADAAAAHIAARAGASVDPAPFRPVLRGKLMTGRGEQFLRHHLHGGDGPGEVADVRLWWPPTKVSGHYLSQYVSLEDARADGHAVEVEVAL